MQFEFGNIYLLAIYHPELQLFSTKWRRAMGRKLITLFGSLAISMKQMIPSRCLIRSRFHHWLATSIPRDSTLIEVRDSTVSLAFKQHICMLLFLLIKGSLTTPKCHPAVTWIIFPDTLAISLNQMTKFRSLSNGIEGLLLVDNFRHLQPIGNRKVFLRSMPTRFTLLEKLVIDDGSDANADDEDPSFWYYNWKSNAGEMSIAQIYKSIKHVYTAIYTSLLFCLQMRLFSLLQNCHSQPKNCWTWIFEHKHFSAGSIPKPPQPFSRTWSRQRVMIYAAMKYVFMFLCCAIF